MRIRVVLPAPLGPSSPNIPRGTSRSTPCKAATGPGNTFTRSRIISMRGPRACGRWRGSPKVFVPGVAIFWAVARPIATSLTTARRLWVPGRPRMSRPGRASPPGPRPTRRWEFGHERRMVGDGRGGGRRARPRGLPGRDGGALPTHLAAYLLRIARSRLADEARARARLGTSLASRARDESSPTEPVDPAPGPAESAAEAEMAGRADRALRELPEHLREVVVLRLYEGLDYAAIGRVVDAKETTVRSRMRYALQSLRKALDATREP